MANVKFYQGAYANSANNPANAIGFLTGGPGEASSDTGYGYIYLGTELVATKYLKELSQRGLTQATSSYNQILSLNWESNASVISTTRLVKSADVMHTSGTPATYDYTPLDTDIMTAAGVASYVSRANETNDKYHTTGSWGSSENWKTYTATAVNGAGALAFTLPIADPSAVGYDYSADNNHLTTPKQVADFFSGLSGGMRYMGELTSNTVASATPAQPGDNDGKIQRNGKPGDVYIWNTSSTTIGTSPNQRTLENGDMIVLNTNYVSNSVLSYSNGSWNFDQFERNLDGSVKITAAMTSGKFVTSTGSDTIASMTTDVRGALGSIIVGAGSNDDPAWLAKGSSGQILGAGATTIGWIDYYYQTVAAHSTDANKIVVTPYTNGTAGTATTITINDVAHATNSDNVKHVADTSTSTEVPLLMAGTTTTNNNASVKFGSTSGDGRVTMKPSTGDVYAHNITLQSTSNNVTNTIDVYDTLIWHTISAS